MGSAQRVSLYLVYSADVAPNIDSSILSRCREGLRAIQPPEVQNAPVLSAVNDCATSGEWPPRIDAMILSSEMPPTTLTLMFGWVCSNCLTVSLTTPSSRSVNPTQSVMLPDADLPLPPAGVPEDAAFWESLLPPPQP